MEAVKHGGFIVFIGLCNKRIAASFNGAVSKANKESRDE